MFGTAPNWTICVLFDENWDFISRFSFWMAFCFVKFTWNLKSTNISEYQILTKFFIHFLLSAGTNGWPKIVYSNSMMQMYRDKKSWRKHIVIRIRKVWIDSSTANLLISFTLFTHFQRMYNLWIFSVAQQRSIVCCAYVSMWCDRDE